MVRSSFVITLLTTAALLGTAATPATATAQDPTTRVSIVGTLPARIGAPLSALATRVSADTVVSRMDGPWVATASFPTTQVVTDAAAHRDDPHLGAGKNLAMMGVGAAAVVIGLLVGDTAGTGIAVGGGLLGLYGFYEFLR